jgi:hypothetical protein
MSVKTFTTEVLTSADTNTYLANSGLVYVTSATIGTTVSSVTVSSAFSATYDNYLIMTTGGVASGDINMRVTLGSTATGYYFSGTYVQYTSTTVNGRASANDTSWDAGYGNTNSCSSRIELENPFNAKRTIIRSAATNPGTAAYMNSYAGFLNDATSYTAFTITPGGGTMTGGTITVYGYRKA